MVKEPSFHTNFFPREAPSPQRVLLIPDKLCTVVFNPFIRRLLTFPSKSIFVVIGEVRALMTTFSSYRSCHQRSLLRCRLLARSLLRLPRDDRWEQSERLDVHERSRRHRLHVSEHVTLLCDRCILVLDGHWALQEYFGRRSLTIGCCARSPWKAIGSPPRKHSKPAWSTILSRVIRRQSLPKLARLASP